MIKKILLALVSVIALTFICLMVLPSTYHLRRALLYMYPKIDQYTLFENRVVTAGNPQPWPLAHDYGTRSIAERYVNRFEELETVAYLVLRGDSIVFEQYWDGYGPDSYSNSFSMAKSIVSLLVGIAIDEGKIRDVHRPVSDFLPEFGSYGGSELTIEHLLTMSGGIEWDESYSGLFSITTKAYYGRDLEGMVRGTRQISEPGVRFNYQSGITQILGFILERATGETLSQYASRKLWTPLGAEHDALWSLDRKNGHEKAYCCFNSNARDFARFGRLILNRGEWNGRQVVPEWYIDRATAPARWLIGESGDGPNTTYGYQFWILERYGRRIPYMRGILGQTVLVLPEEDAVIVRLGRKRSEVRTTQNYPDDIDTWLDAGMEILGRRELVENIK